MVGWRRCCPARLDPSRPSDSYWCRGRASSLKARVPMYMVSGALACLGSTILFDRDITSLGWYLCLVQPTRPFAPKSLWISSLLLLFLLSCGLLLSDPFLLCDCVRHSLVLWLGCFLTCCFASGFCLVFLR